MTVGIHKLTPEFASDFFDFFDNHAFSDREGAFCYCTWFHFDCAIEEYYKHGKEAMRSQAAAYITSGKLNVYLAFADGVSIGWCNADNRENYQRIKTDPFICRDNIQQTKAIVCFAISPDFRGKGIATALLQKVVEDAKAEGYFAVEGYPHLHSKREPFDYTGPMRLYEKTGFVKIAEQNKIMIMRKELE
jgi:GNAT superfamily N-acetyltransferase